MLIIFSALRAVMITLKLCAKGNLQLKVNFFHSRCWKKQVSNIMTKIRLEPVHHLTKKKKKKKADMVLHKVIFMPIIVV